MEMEEEQDASETGPEEDHSATSHHGNDPGHLYGQGACMYITEPVNTTPITKDAEIALLTQQKNAIELQVKAMQQTLEKIQAKLDKAKQ